jgi:hypothetical protein
MKFICLGYFNPDDWETMPEEQRSAWMDECFAYDDVLREHSHFAGGEALDLPRSATTLRYRDGKVQATDGPFAETKEQLGGILILEARDMAHAVELMSRHPGVRAGAFEIRPAADLGAMIEASRARRGKAASG